MKNIVVECRRCKGKGTIVCNWCGGAGSIPSFALSLSAISQGLPGYVDCSICKGIGELQCPACDGKAAYATEALKEKDGRLLTAVNRSDKRDRQAERGATTARLVLAIHHLLDQANANFSNKAAEIRSIPFLTGRTKTTLTKKLTEIRERGNPADKRNKKVKLRSPKARKEDLEFIKPLSGYLKLTTIVNSIDDEIRSIDEDIL